jgi:alpha-L-fucosidase
MVLGASSHRAEHYWFFDGGLDFDSDVTDESNKLLYGGDYGNTVHGPKDLGLDIYGVPPTKPFLDNWLARACEIVDRYQPKIVYFDAWIQNVAFKPYSKKFAAYYYNRAAEWGVEVAINYKYDAFMLGSAVYDVERGQLTGISPRLWQTDTAIGKNSWGYTENNEFKDPVDIVSDLIDIVSKNGCLLLNVGPKSDGTISDQDKNVLLGIGNWLAKNGEGIYDTTYWRIYGEGPTKICQGAFTDIDRESYTSEDIRFTYKKGTLFAFVMKVPEDGVVRIKELRKMVRDKDWYLGDILSISVLGYDNRVTYERVDDYLTISIQGKIDTEYPIVLKIILD